MSGETILIVEDNDVLRQGLQVMLESEGFQVRVASQGLEGLEQMQMMPPDLILADISMPEMDGYTFFNVVRSKAEWLSIPFIFLTARGAREDIFAGKRLGVEDYLVKPVPRQELVTTIRSRLNRSHELLLAQLEHAYQASLIMLANAIELRDHYTRGHVERVRDYAICIARNLGWTKTRMSQIEFGSILHDIGKIQISKAVLTKPGKLSNAEWDEMRRHPEIGAEMVKNIPYLAPAVPVIACHHERWNGSGYPSGIMGEEIPLAARVVAVADALDAMTTTRSYRTALTIEQAYSEIMKYSGEFYDPGVVSAFQGAWDAILKRYHQSNNHELT